MKKLRFFSKLACMVIALSIAFDGVCLAQSRREAGVGSLLEMKCYGQSSGNGLFARNVDGLVVNRKTYTTVGSFTTDLSFQGPWGIKRGEAVEATCDLAGRNRSPIYKNLSMTIGMSDNSSFWEGRYAARVRLTTYLDGQYSGSLEIGFRELKRFSLDISGIRNVSFTVECFNPSNMYDLCPNLHVVEDKLY